MKSILIVDDDLMSLEFLKIHFESESYTVIEAHDVAGALEIIEKNKPDILMTDLKLGEESGETILEYIQSHNYNIRTVIMSGYSKADLNNKSLSYDHYITKPIDLDAVSKLLSQNQPVNL